MHVGKRMQSYIMLKISSLMAYCNYAIQFMYQTIRETSIMPTN